MSTVPASRHTPAARRRAVPAAAALLAACLAGVAHGACGPLTGEFALAGGAQVDIGSNGTVNGHGVARGETGADSVVRPDGTRATEARSLPDLVPAAFPPNPAGRDADQDDSPFASAAEVHYHEIEADNGATLRFSGGGPFHIAKLEAGNGVTLNLGAGTYFIGELDLGNNARLVVTGEPVVLHVGSGLDLGNDAVLNPGGSVTGLQVLLHAGAELDAGNGLDFTGLVYGPDPDTEVDLGNNAEIRGAVVVGGGIDVGNNLALSLTPADAALLGGLSTCPGPDHFRLVHDGFGIYCLDEHLSVEPRDAAGAVYPGFTGTVVLATQSGAGTWVATTGDGILADATPDDGLATYAFSGAESLPVGFTLRYRAGPAAIDVDVYQAGAPAVRDDDAEGPLGFHASGFTLAPAPPGSPPGAIAPIPAQTAGAPFAVFLTAYGQTPADPECGVIESYAGTRPLKLWSRYQNPATGTRAVTVDGLAVAPAEALAAARPVDFQQGRAVLPLAVKYKDVGRIALAAKDEAEAGPELPDGVRGSSNLFVVRPAELAIGAVVRTADGFPNPGASGPGGPVFAAAGEDFSVTVTALDAEGDATPNFGLESPAEGVALGAALVAPAGGAAPALESAAGFGGFGAGTATGTAFRWAEVGVITLTPSIADGDYLGTGDVPGAATGNVGRFVPHDFEVTLVSAPAFAPACTGFTYLDQPFDYAIPPAVRITARNAAGATTANYDGPWWRLADFTETLSHDGPLPGGVVLDTGLAAHTPIDCAAGGCAGETSVAFTGPLAYARGAAPVAPFDGRVDIRFAVQDADGVGYAGNPFRIEDIGFTGGAAALRDGRLALDNAHGSELLALAVPTRAEYFDGTGFVVNADDGCTALAVGSLRLANDAEADQTDGDIALGGGSTAASLAHTPFAAGEAGLVFSAPGAGNTGFVDIVPDLSPGTGAGLPWLRFDWDGDGAADDPRARASFGIFGGSPFLIHLREPWN